MRYEDEVDDKMSEDGRYRPFKYSCYKGQYEHDEGKYNKQLSKYIKKTSKNDESVVKSNTK